MLSRLAQYGEIIAQYSGEGEIIANGQEPLACNFEIGQLFTGKILAHFSTSSPIVDDGTNIISFNGKTNNGKNISLDGYAIAHRQGHMSEGYYSHYTSSGEIHLRIENENMEDIKEVRFGITNLMFVGLESEQIGQNYVINGLRLSFDNIEIHVRQLDDHKEIIKSLSNNKNTAITAEMIIKWDVDAQDKIFEVVDNLCNLLTIARGRKINWIYYKFLNNDGELVIKEHQERITAPYAGYEIIDPMPPEDTVYFLNKCYPAYKKLNRTYEFGSVANILVDANSRGFIETRCLAIGALVQYIVKKNSKKEAFRDRIKETVKKHHLSITSSEIKAFVKSRNKLAHQMKFSTLDSQSEYMANLHFLHKMLLGILNYDGFYVDVTDLPYASGSRKHKLTPTS